MTLHEGLRQVLCNSYDTIYVERDSQLLIQAINRKIYALWKIKLLVINIMKLASHCTQIRFTHVLRKEIFLVDAIIEIMTLKFRGRPSLH